MEQDSPIQSRDVSQHTRSQPEPNRSFDVVLRSLFLVPFFGPIKSFSGLILNKDTEQRPSVSAEGQTTINTHPSALICPALLFTNRSDVSLDCR